MTTETTQRRITIPFRERLDGRIGSCYNALVRDRCPGLTLFWSFRSKAEFGCSSLWRATVFLFSLKDQDVSLTWINSWALIALSHLPVRWILTVTLDFIVKSLPRLVSITSCDHTGAWKPTAPMVGRSFKPVNLYSPGVADPILYLIGCFRGLTAVLFSGILMPYNICDI